MPSLLVVVFILQLAIHIINSVGATAVNELAWIVYNKFPTPTSSAAQKASSLRKEVFRLKQELNGLSAQDEFSKWAKVRRQHDKAAADYEKCSSSLQSSKTRFNTAVGSVRWTGTNGLRIGLQIWYSRQPMYWIPSGWLPSTAEWLLAFPRAPTGSISFQVWGLACASVIALVSDALTAAYSLSTGIEASKKSEQKTQDPLEAEEAKKSK